VSEGKFSVVIGQKTVQVETSWPIDSLTFTAKINNADVIIQLMKRIPHGYLLQHVGTQFSVSVQTPREHELYQWMPVKTVVHTEKLVESPMPGRITSVAVQVGDKVHLGQELLVVEAMKMQNVLRAQIDSKVKSIKVKPGDDVQVDQILVELE